MHQLRGPSYQLVPTDTDRLRTGTIKLIGNKDRMTRIKRPGGVRLCVWVSAAAAAAAAAARDAGGGGLM